MRSDKDTVFMIQYEFGLDPLGKTVEPVRIDQNIDRFTPVPMGYGAWNHQFGE